MLHQFQSNSEEAREQRHHGCCDSVAKAVRFLDDQFAQLRKLQDEQRFLDDHLTIALQTLWLTLSLFFRDSEKVMNNMARLLEQNVVDFKLLNTYVHQIKGSSAWIGAMRVQNACIDFRNYCEAQNVEGCMGCLRQVRQECLTLKNNLENLFLLEQQIVASGGTVPDME